jgi:hypothetical protein
MPADLVLGHPQAPTRDGGSMTALPCPVDGCNRQRRSVDELLCPRCWHLVPHDLRSAVWRIWKRYQAGRAGPGELRGVQRQAIDSVQL